MAAVLAEVAFGAHEKTVVAIERPQLPWLFAGFGFQNAEAQLTPLMTETFSDERAVKSFRELSPLVFARVRGAGR